MPEWLRLLLSLIGIIIIIAGAYYATYYIGTKASGQSRGRIRGGNRRINMLDRFAIAKDKSFCVIEIAGKVYIVGVTNQSMTLLDKLDAEEFAEYMAKTGSGYKETWSATPGGPFSGKLVNRLASFMAQRMGRTVGNPGNMGAGFAANMKTAQERNFSGQPDRDSSERPDDPEGEE